MKIKDALDKYNDTVTKAWLKPVYQNLLINHYGGKDNILLPLQYPSLEFRRIDLLFVGLNPSFNTRDLKRLLKNIPKYKHFTEGYIRNLHTASFEMKDNERLTQIKKIHSYALTVPDKHFIPIQRFADSLGANWYHIDIYPLRHSKGTDVIEFFNKHTLFEKRLFDLFLELVENLEPKFIIVENGEASKVLQQKLSPFYLNSGKKKFPIQFSGMWTSRAYAKNKGRYLKELQKDITQEYHKVLRYK